VTFGTGAFVQCLTGALVRPDRPGPLPTVAWQQAGQPVAYALDGGVYAAGAAVNWACGLGLCDDLAGISAFAAPSAIDRGLAFVPALAGLGCPHWDRGVRGAWMGLALASDRTDMMQALLEGIALRTAEVLSAMEALHPFRGPVSVDGGLSRNGYFAAFLAETAGYPLFLPYETEQTALGLARMAAEAAGLSLPAPRPGRDLPGGPAPRADRLARFAAARQAITAYAAASAM
jgi:glycerol kinase